jgi:hypothetical protein
MPVALTLGAAPPSAEARPGRAKLSRQTRQLVAVFAHARAPFADISDMRRSPLPD